MSNKEVTKWRFSTDWNRFRGQIYWKHSNYIPTPFSKLYKTQKKKVIVILLNLKLTLVIWELDDELIKNSP
jgi:hypothetical protein